MYAPEIGRIKFSKAVIGNDGVDAVVLSHEAFHSLRMEIATLIAQRTHEFPMLIRLFSLHHFLPQAESEPGVATPKYEHQFVNVEAFMLIEEVELILMQYPSFDYRTDLYRIHRSLRSQVYTQMTASIKLL